MTRWIRFEHEGRAQFGTLEGETIRVHEGDMFAGAKDTGRTVALAAVKLLTPCVPTKMVALWNNYRALAEKLGQATPPEPLWFLKANSSFHPGGQPIRVPASNPGKVIFEGELGIVIGKRASRVSGGRGARAHLRLHLHQRRDGRGDPQEGPDASTSGRARKSFDTFGVFGPVIATGLDPATLVIRTVLNGQERQNYPASDMFFPPARLVSLISQDLTFEPGDVICCGTSVGVGSMKPGQRRGGLDRGDRRARQPLRVGARPAPTSRRRRSPSRGARSSRARRAAAARWGWCCRRPCPRRGSTGRESATRPRRRRPGDGALAQAASSARWTPR